MNPWRGLTPEEHQAMVRKTQATRKANREKLEQERLEMRLQGDVLFDKIKGLEKRLIELSKYEELSALSAALNDRALLPPEEIIKGAIPFEIAVHSIAGVVLISKTYGASKTGTASLDVHTLIPGHYFTIVKAGKHYVQKQFIKL
jgi:hypothetical protein